MGFIQRKGVRLGIAAMASLVAVSALVYQTSNAAFTDTTDNAGSSWTAGSVTLTDDDGGSAMFTSADMVPGDAVENCITVDYTGSTFDLDQVKLYGSVTDNGLGGELDLVVEEGTGGGFGDCTGFSPAQTVFASNTLNAFGAAHSSYANGAGGYTPASGSTSRTYRFSVTLGTDTPNSAQGTDATATFTWEVQSA